MMLKTSIIATLVSLTLSAVAASAGTIKSKGLSYFGPVITSKCPPGLAKKSPACIPPGQARKIYPDYRPRYDAGDRIYDEYRIIRDLDRYGLREGYLYYLVGREVFRISPETGRVIAFIGLADALLN